jgi:hypothetical protein
LSPPWFAVPVRGPLSSFAVPVRCQPSAIPFVVGPLVSWVPVRVHRPPGRLSFVGPVLILGTGCLGRVWPGGVNRGGVAWWLGINKHVM